MWRERKRRHVLKFLREEKKSASTFRRAFCARAMAPDAREPRLLHVLTDARGRDFAALDDALGEAGGALVRRACVAVRGLSPVGVETARLLLASDVGEIVLLDEPRDAAVTPADIGATSVLTEEHLGKPRSRAVVEALNSRRFRPAHRESPVVRAAGPRDALWTGRGETVARDDERVSGSSSRRPDVLVSAWHLDTPWMADDGSSDGVASAVLEHGGTHVLAAAPGLFAFVRAARRKTTREEDEKKSSVEDASASSDSDSDEPRLAFLRDPDRVSVRVPERRFRDARLARAPVSLVESVVPADDDDDEETGKTAKLFFVTVCDANAHSLREGDGVAFIDPLEDDSRTIAEGTAGAVKRGGERSKSAVVGVVRSIAGRHAFSVSIEKATLRGSDASRLAGTYARQRRRRDARDETRPAFPFSASTASSGIGRRDTSVGSKRKREASESNEEDERRVAAERNENAFFSAAETKSVRSAAVDPRDVFGVSSFVFARDAATVPPAVAAARVATAFLRLSFGNERRDVEKDDVDASDFLVTNGSVDDSSLAIEALRRGARVAFPPCVGVAAAVAAHETLKTLARVQIPLVEMASDRGGWFAHDFLELDPSFSRRKRKRRASPKNVSSSRNEDEDAVFFDDDSELETNQRKSSAATVADLIGAELVREAAARETVVVGAAAFGRAFDETLAHVARVQKSWSAREKKKTPIRSYPSLDAVPLSYADSAVDVVILAGVEGFESRRAADTFSTRSRFSLIDVGVENHSYSAYVAAVDVTAPWSVSGARDPAEPSFPSCVVGNFPHTFPHCAQWARERFTKAFVELPGRIREWADAWTSFAARDENENENDAVRSRPDREAFFRERAGASMKASCDEEAHAFVIAAVRASSASTRGRSVRDGGDGFRRACVSWGFELFDSLFAREPRRLLRANPPDSRTANGASFWSGTKRLPRALAFDATDPRRATFVVAAAMLFAALFSSVEGSPSNDDEREPYEPEEENALRAGAFLETLLETAREDEEKNKKSGAGKNDSETRRDDDDGTGMRTEKDASETETLSADRLAEATLDAFEDGRFLSKLSPSTPFEGHRRDPTRAAFVAAAAACRAVVFGVPVPRERELAAAATGSRPGTPAPAAFAAALAAVETYKLAASTAAKSSSPPSPLDEKNADASSAAARNPSDFRLDRKPLRAFSSLREENASFVYDDDAVAFRCSYGSLGGHAHVSASPAALETKTAKTSRVPPFDLRFTAWDAFVFDARDGATLADFLHRFRAAVGLEPSTVARGKALLFADFMNLAKPETAARMNTPLQTLFEDVLDGSDEDEEGTKKEERPVRVLVSVTACDENDDDVEIPETWVRIR